MNNTFKRFFTALLVVAASFATVGCATHGDRKTASLGDGDKVFVAPVVRVDQIVNKVSEVEGTVYELSLVQIGWQEPDGKGGKKWVLFLDKDTGKMVPAITRFHRETRTTPFGQTITVTLLNGVLPAVVNGEYAKQIAKAASCKQGSVCADNINMIDVFAQGGAGGQGGVGLGVGGAAQAVSGSQSGASSTANVTNSGGATSPCSTCGGQ